MKKKILFIIAILMVISTIARTLIVGYTFIDFQSQSIKNETKLIKDILLESADMQKSLRMISHSSDIKHIEILKKKLKEKIEFNIDKKTITSISCLNSEQSLKIVFNGKELLAQSYLMFSKIILIAIISLILIIVITNYFITPYLEVTEKIKESIKLAKVGNFKNKIDTNLSGDTKEFVDWYNTLLDKLQNTFGIIEEKYKILIDKKEVTEDPLIDARNTMEELANIYQFKQIIENDLNVDTIYHRLIHLMKDRFKFQDFSIYEIDNDTKEISRKFIEGNICCSIGTDPENCRVYRTSQRINSIRTPDICTENYCDSKYYCFPYSTTGKFTGIVTINFKNEEEYIKNRDKASFIRSYFKEASSIIESKHTLNVLKKSSLTDQMTGLYNRRYLDEIITKIAPSTIREKSMLGILMIDIDFFKKVNDEFGHDAGDMVLKTLSSVLTNSVRESDLVIRYGGEEFIIILQNIKDEKGITEVAENIRKKFEETKSSVNGKTLTKTISIGVSIFPKDSTKIWECIKYADLALYEAKNTGRNKVIKFSTDLAEKSGYNEGKS